MSQDNNRELQRKAADAKPEVTTYDSGHEHSIEHWVEVRLMVEESEQEESGMSKPRALAAGA